MSKQAKEIARINNLFKNFALIFSTKWHSSIGTEAEDVALLAAEWAKSCSMLTDKQMQNALEKCKNILDWAPSIAKFKMLALDILSADVAFELLMSHIKEKSKEVLKKTEYGCTLEKNGSFSDSTNNKLIDLTKDQLGSECFRDDLRTAKARFVTVYNHLVEQVLLGKLKIY